MEYHYQLLTHLNRSWPAVSQICNLIFWPETSTILVPNSTPIVWGQSAITAWEGRRGRRDRWRGRWREGGGEDSERGRKGQGERDGAKMDVHNKKWCISRLCKFSDCTEHLHTRDKNKVTVAENHLCKNLWTKKSSPMLIATTPEVAIRFIECLVTCPSTFDVEWSFLQSVWMCLS